MAAGVVVAAYCFSRILWGHLTGVVAALLTMLNYLMFYYSRTGNLDVPAFFWISLALVVFAKILRETLTSRRAACLGVLAGLAMATKDQAVTIFLPLGLFLLSRRFSWSSETGYRVRPLLIGLGAFVLAYVVGTGMLIDPQRHINHVYYLFFNQERLTWASFYHPPHPKTLEGLVNLVVDSGRSFFAAMSPPTLLASVAGVLLTLRFSPRLLVLLLPIVVQLLILNLPTGYAILRYLLPFTFVIDAFAASAVVMLRGSSLRALWIPALVILCGWRLLIGADLTYAQYHDTRYAASDWLRANAKPGDRVEFFGIGDAMPYLPAEILSRRVGGRTQWKRESGHGSYVLDYLADKGPEYVVIVPDATSRPGMEYSGDCPPEVYAALMSETAQYKLAAYFPTRSFLPRAFQRPSLDNPSVCPPVRIFAK
jgi:4-amino-4-deoxy-L-arabinose transferase-like glycosyltransferase